MTTILTAVTFLLMFCTLVAVHEWGHYLAARWMKMGVDEFAIGFGKVLKTWKRKDFQIGDDTHETVFNLRAIPLGGFVRITGMEPKEDGSEVHIANGFYSKKPIARIVTLVAGPLFSVIFGVILLFALIAVIGVKTPVPVVNAIVKQSAADKAGVQLGDRIVAIEGKTVNEPIQVVEVIRSRLGKPVAVQVKRGTSTLDFQMTPALSKEKYPVLDKNGLPTGRLEQLPRIGIEFATEYRRVPAGEALVASVSAPIISFERLFFRLTQPVQILEESTGVVGMVAKTNEAVQGGVDEVIYISAVISIGLGIANLLPIGMLDGGQILLAFIEMLNRNRRLSFRLQSAYLTVGLAFMALAFILITRQDIIRFVLPK